MNKSVSIKALFVALFLCSVEVIYAESLDEEQARYAAAEFFSTSSQSARLRARGRQLVLRSQGHEGGYYIFERPEGGVVFVADDDAIGRTVLGYTDSGSYDADNLPAGLQDWLGQVTVLMNAVHEGKIKKENVQRKVGSIVVDALIQTRWNQGAPYNNLCPISNGQRCVTGCVATAMAQVMKYWKWPEHGYGSVTYTDTYGCGQTLSQNLSSDYYDWDNMLNTYSNGYTTTQSTAVATLMRDCGYAVYMQYTPNSSGAYMNDCISAMQSYFHYSTEATFKSANNYSEDTWHTLIQQDHRAARPVLYSGVSIEGGHAFILDGYDTGGYYHVNWGWGGSQDGWFMLTNLNGYNNNQWMINNLKPYYDDGEDVNNIKINGIYYALDTDNGTAIVIENPNKYSGAVNIPESITYSGKTFIVTDIDMFAFSGCNSLTSVIIPSSMTSIASYAFYSSGLTSITIPESVTSIGNWAFDNCCNLISVTIPNSVTCIGGGAFEGCSSLSSVTIGDGIVSIGMDAFNSCSSLTSITIPNSVTSIGGWAFSGTGWYNAQPDGILYIDNWLIGYKGTKPTGNVTINSGTRGIAGLAFDGCSGLTSVTIPNGVTSIGDYAFDGCSGLTSITIGNSVTDIGNDAFRGTPWYNNQPNGLVYAGKVAYKYRGTMPTGTQITIKDGTIGIADGAFLNCSGLTSITIPNSVSSIGDGAFSGCTGLTSVTIPNSVTTIWFCTFRGCSGLTSVTIPESVTSIDDSAFSSCSSLISVSIPNSVTSIGRSAFDGCSGLTSITIPNSVISIGYRAFAYCSGLKEVYCYAENVPETEYNAFYGSPISSATLHVPYNSLDAYSTTYPWSNFGTIVGIDNSPIINFADANVKRLCVENWDTNKDGELSEAEAAAVTSLRSVFHGNKEISSFNELLYFTGLKSIGEDAFYGCSGLTSITIPNSVTSIGNYAFENCSGLTSVTISNSVTSIGNGAFYGCSGLTSVTIPNSVTCIGYSAFYGCSGLTSVTIPNSVTSIGYNAFEYCTGLTSIAIPNRVKCIEGRTFNGCTSLSSVTIPNSVTSIGDYAFFCCTNLTSVHISDLEAWCRIDFNNDFDDYTANPLCYAHHLFLNGVEIKDLVIPSSVTSIGNGAFYGCSGLNSVTIPNSVTSIGDQAFSGCNGLTSVHISDLEAWCKISFYSSYYYSSDNYSSNPLQYAHHLYLNGEEIKNLIIPDDIATIKHNAFSDCSGLVSVTIPNSVTQIGRFAFFGCSGMTNVYSYAAEPPIAHYESMEFPGVSFSFDESYIKEHTTLHVPYNSLHAYSTTYPWSEFKNIVAIEDIIEINGIYYALDIDNRTAEVISNPNGYTGAVVIPECVTYNGKTYTITSIGKRSFDSCSKLTSITIPESVTSIGEYAFFNCMRLESVVIPNKVTIIASGAFAYCPNLASVTIGNSVTSIGVGAFAYCQELYDFYCYAEEVPRVYDEAFYNSYIDGAILHVPAGSVEAYKTTAPWSEFGTIVAIEDNTPIIEFVDANVKAICVANWDNDDDGELSESEAAAVTDIGRIFKGNKQINSFDELQYFTGLTSIEDNAFRGCTSLTSVIIPENVTSIGSDAFSGCTSLTSITIPASVTSIGDFALSNCSNLTIVYCYAETVPSASDDTFDGTNIGAATLYVPKVSLEAYKTTAPWNGFGSIVPIEGYTTYNINNEMASLNIATEESGCIVNFTHAFNGEWEALYLPFAIDYEAIKNDFDLAEIDGIVQNDDDFDGIPDFTVLSIMGLRKQMTTPNKPYLIRAKNAGEQTITFNNITVYPTTIESIDCSSTSTRFEFTGSYNALDVSALANRYVIQNGELVKGASALAPCRWYMKATARNGASFSLPSKIRVMSVENVIDGVSPLEETEERAAYDIQGRKLGKPQKGINIIRYSDGTTRKVVIK